MSAAVVWHRTLMPEVDRHVPRLPRSAVTVARTLCELAAAGQGERAFGGVYAVAARAAAHNGGRPLHPRTVQRALALLVDHGLIERVIRGGRGKVSARRARGGRGIASIYALGGALRRRLSRIGRYVTRGFARNYGRTAVPESRDIYPCPPVEGGAALRPPDPGENPPRRRDPAEQPLAALLPAAVQELTGALARSPEARRDRPGDDGGQGVGR